AVVKRTGMSPGMLLDVLTSAKTLNSDYELAELLVGVGGSYVLDDALRPAFFAAANNLGSDYEHGRTLLSVVERGELSRPVALAVLESAKGIGSDHELSELLLAVIKRAPNDDAIRAAIRTDAASISSQYDRGRVFSRDPSKIQAPLSRRDNTFQSERMWVSFDSYHDKRTAYSFGISASGVRADWYHASDNENDINWGFDPVWEAKANIDALGWTAEMRIPFSQLRFTNQPVQVWGFNANRWNPVTSEDDYWIPVPTNRTGWSSFMGELVGIAGIKPTRRLELMPYGAVDSRVLSNVSPVDPFNDKANFAGRVGADLKMGLGPNITLDATVNPDFGQVEADPSIVNLSGFEFFFDEKRPFFTEGSQ